MKKGFYWVKFRGEWTVGSPEGGLGDWWYLVGSEEPMKASEFDEVGKYIGEEP